MTTFTLYAADEEYFDTDVEVRLTDNITRDQLLNFEAFTTWRQTLGENLRRQKDPGHPFHPCQYSLRRITLQSVDWKQTKDGRPPTAILFLKFEALIQNDRAETLPGIVFLRGGSVAMLMILKPTDNRDERLVILTEQPRIPAGSLSFIEIPAGMIEGEKKHEWAATREIEEETGLHVPPSELIDLTKMALEQAKANESERSEAAKSPMPDRLMPAMYPSPGGSDEFIKIYLWLKEVDRVQIENIRGKFSAAGGDKRPDEKIRLHLCKYSELWKVATRDSKTLAAWALYEGLNRSEALEEDLLRKKRERGFSGGLD